MAVVDLVERDARRDEALEGQAAGAPQVDVARDVAARHRRAEVAADDVRASAVSSSGETLARASGAGEADGHGRAAGAP